MDVIKQIVVILEQTPRTAWESRLRREFGGEAHYLAKRAPRQDHDQLRALIDAGFTKRAAMYRVRGY